VGKTEEARVFRENFYGGKLFQCLNKKDNKNSTWHVALFEFFIFPSTRTACCAGERLLGTNFFGLVILFYLSQRKLFTI
jgi:hypothetical protein